MKNDLDALMQTRQLDALLVIGPGGTTRRWST